MFFPLYEDELSIETCGYKLFFTIKIVNLKANIVQIFYVVFSGKSENVKNSRESEGNREAGLHLLQRASKNSRAPLVGFLFITFSLPLKLRRGSEES